MKYSASEALNMVKECGLNIEEPPHNEVLNIVIEALEKRIHKKPLAHGKYGFACPSCKQKLSVEREDIFVYDMKPPEHCEPCGQALDWSDI